VHVSLNLKRPEIKPDSAVDGTSEFRMTVQSPKGRQIYPSEAPQPEFAGFARLHL